MFRCSVASPLGELTLASDGQALTGLWLPGQKYFAAGLEDDAAESPELPVFQQTRAWLAAYFDGKGSPELPSLAPPGTVFQQSVWNLLLKIPYGETVSYGTLAAQLKEHGASTFPRAVGGAVGHNPISILIPCHRVVGASGSLTGYAGGLAAKKFLLTLERERRDRLSREER